MADGQTGYVAASGVSARPYLVLAAGVAVVSTASILIRLAQAEGVPSLAIAAVRLGLASLALLPFALVRARSQWAQASIGHLGLAVASGGLLAIHFWAWIASLEYTSVASSTILVTTNPLWVGLASLALLGERLTPYALAGIGLSLAGTVLTFAAGAQSAAAPAPLLGNALALLGAVSASGYLLIGRALRGRLGLLAYIALAYGAAALFLWFAMLVTGAAVRGHSGIAWLLLILLAIGPQLIGHTSFNWALRRMSATFVALAILGEPVGSALLAWLIFEERFTLLQAAGFGVLLAGIFLAARGEGRRADEAR
jgi:drug/metabolite transporter (DMT)-like permease